MAEQAWLRGERARHEEFVLALRDPGRANDTIVDARYVVEQWGSDTTRTIEEIEGWQAVLTLTAGTIAMLLEEQSHPLLQKRHHESPFNRMARDPESQAFHRRLQDERLYISDATRRSIIQNDKRKLSLANRVAKRYCTPMTTLNPSHPGTYVREQCLERFKLSVTEGARVLGVSRQALTNLLTGRAGISPEMALRLDMAFGGGAETWLQRQLLHDLAQAREKLADLKVVQVVSEKQSPLF